MPVQAKVQAAVINHSDTHTDATCDLVFLHTYYLLQRDVVNCDPESVLVFLTFDMILRIIFSICFCVSFDLQPDTIDYDLNQLSLVTRKYPLRGYILGVLTHTTAWDRHWGGDETLR